MREIAALLTRHQLRSRLVLVPFGELQQQVLLGVPPELRVVIYRRLMLRIAERLARRWRARALVTGEVIGQVASQTLENLTDDCRRDDASRSCGRWSGWTRTRSRPRPARIGTLPISNIPDQDCCQLFTPRHPATRARTQDDRSRPKRRCRSSAMVDAAVAAAVGGGLQIPGARIPGWPLSPPEGGTTLVTVSA